MTFVACALAKDGYPDQAMASLRGYQIDPDAFPTLVKNLGPQHLDWCEQELKKLEASGKGFTRHYNALFTQIEKAGDTERGRRLIRQMRERGIQPDEVTYHIWINSCGKRKELGRCRELFEEMKTRGVKIDVVVFNIMMEAYGREGEIGRCLDLKKEMTSLGVKPDVTTYTTLIGNCRISGKTEMCDLLFKEMKNEGINPDIKVCLFFCLFYF